MLATVLATLASAIVGALPIGLAPAAEDRAVVPAAGRPVATAPADDPAPAAPRLLSAADRRSFAALERRLGGASGVALSAVGPGQRVFRAGALRRGVAWSTSKVPVAMAAIDAGVADADDLRRAITASDNAAAERLWTALGGGSAAARAATDQLRAGGDARTTVESRVLRSGYTAFGQTDWRLEDQVRFTATLPCSPTGRRLLTLMGRVIPSQRWGLGATAWSARLKGGWGPGSRPGRAGGDLDRQLGILSRGGRRLAVAILHRPADGAHGSGTAALTRIARWVVSHVDRRALPSDDGCA